MDAAQSRFPRPLGLTRLVDHCEALRRVTGEEATSARSRLELELGSELTSRLVGALASGPRGRLAPIL